MKHRSMDVTYKTNPSYLPPTHFINGRGQVREQDPTPARRLNNIEPPTQVSGLSKGIYSRESNQNRPPATFALPEKVSASEIQQQSFRYGGRRR